MESRIRVRVIVALVGSAAFPAALHAHHSTAEYDSDTVVESQGVVTKVLWQNPHVRLEVDTQRFDGAAEIWHLEGQSPGDLDRAHIPRDIVEPGDTVKFAGNPSTRRDRHMYVTNVLLPDQTEIVLRASAPPRWQPNRYLSYTQASIDPARAAADRGDGIFRVWVPSAQKTPDWASDPPLTPAARAAWKAFDAVRDDPVLACRPPGMPQVITRSGRYGIRFVQRGDDIVLENEYRETDRVIHMTPDAAGAAGGSSAAHGAGGAAGDSPAAHGAGAQVVADARRAPTPLGYSTGKWDGPSLVVTTSNIDYPYFQLYGLEGVPQSTATMLVERFTPSADGRELKYDITATDPRTFTRTVTAEGYRTFRWTPGFEFLPQNCVLDEGDAPDR